MLSIEVEQEALAASEPVAYRLVCLVINVLIIHAISNVMNCECEMSSCLKYS